MAFDKEKIFSAAIAAFRDPASTAIYTNAALYQFAQTNNLGYPQTDEFEFIYDNNTYLAQVFNLGIVYVKKGAWTEVAWVKKP